MINKTFFEEYKLKIDNVNSVVDKRLVFTFTATLYFFISSLKRSSVRMDLFSLTST